MEGKQKILLVDDNTSNIKILNDLLKKQYKISAATNGFRALEIAFSENKPDLILLDILMPDMNGYEVCTKLKDDTSTQDIPIIFVTAMSEVEDEKKGLALGAIDYLTKTIQPEIVLARVATHLELKNARESLKEQNIILEHKVQERTKELVETRLEIIHRLGRAAEYKDNETGTHVIRMSRYCQLIAKEYGMDEEESDKVLNAAPMHDIGKIGIPDHILLKPGKLDADEWNIMKKHPEIGADILSDYDSPLLNLARVAALTHHEKWNGKGYPKGLKGADIPVIGRIVAIADVFDALTSERPYKKAWPVEKATDIISEESGEHFDPVLVKCFLKILPEALKIKEEFTDH